MTLPIIPEYLPPHAHLAEVALLITASIKFEDLPHTIITSSIADTPEEVPTVLADIMFDLEELSQDHLRLISDITETMSQAACWSKNYLTDMPHRMHIMIDGDPEVYVQVYTIVKAVRVEKSA